MERVEEGGCDECLGPYERGGANEQALADAGEAEPRQMSRECDAVVEAYSEAGLIKILIDDDYIERIGWVNSDICHHENANVFLSSCHQREPGLNEERAEISRPLY